LGPSGDVANVKASCLQALTALLSTQVMRRGRIQFTVQFWIDKTDIACYSKQRQNEQHHANLQPEKGQGGGARGPAWMSLQKSCSVSVLAGMK